jgi:hypothetical protein
MTDDPHLGRLAAWILIGLALGVFWLGVLRLAGTVL